MIAVVDYGMGNLRSVQKALQHVGGDAQIVSNPGDLTDAEKIVLPGVGAFGDAIQRLHSSGMVGPIRRAMDQGIPFLGICLGFQLLFDVSYEEGTHQGLGVFPGKIVRFQLPPSVSGENLKIPHMGWNQLQLRGDCPLFRGVESGDYVYFVHSFHAVSLDEEIISATTDYGYRFPSALWKGNLYAVQFHPEKSQEVGLTMLANFVKL